MSVVSPGVSQGESAAEGELLTIDDRASLYATNFPLYPGLIADKGWLLGTWILGNAYGRADQTLYGAYPSNFLKRVRAMFPDAIHVLHLFSGHLKPGPFEVCVDLKIERRPTVVAAAKALPFLPGVFDLVLADPPYSAKDALKYGTPPLHRGNVMRGLRDCVKTGGHVCWLDTVRPMYRKGQWKQIGAIGVSVSTNTRTRMLSIFTAV